MRVVLDDASEVGRGWLLAVAERLANAEVLEPIRAAAALGVLTALNKRNAR